MMFNRIVGLGFVALGADAIALGNELIAMWVVAVAADNPLPVPFCFA